VVERQQALILDAAFPPTVKSKPSRLLIVALGGIVGIFVAFIREAISRRADNPEHAQQWMQLKQHLQIRRQATDTQATTPAATQSNQPAHKAHHQQHPQAKNEGAPHQC